MSEAPALVEASEGNSPKKSAVSRPFDVHRWSDYPELRACISDLVSEITAREGRLRARPQRVANQFSDAVRCIVLDLYVAWCADPSSEVGVSLRKESFAKGGRLDALYFTYDTFRPALEGLLALGYVERPHRGFNDRRTGISFVTRIKATPKLVELMVGSGKLSQSKVQYRANRQACDDIVLRDKDGNEVAYRDSFEIAQMRTDLRKINEHLSSRWIDLCISDTEMAALNAKMTDDYRQERREAPYVDLNEKHLRRIFNNSDWGQGGRFYGGWWQYVPRGYRKFITIDDKPTVEVDFRGMHPAFMYAEASAKPEYEDAYDVGFPNVPRELVKRAFNALVNAKQRPRRLEEYNEEQYGVTWDALLEAIANKHRPIAHLFSTAIGVRLQFKDAQIANQVMLRFLSMNYACLPVHDSFIVHHGLADELIEIMHDEFREAVGAEIGTKLKLDVSAVLDLRPPDCINMFVLDDIECPDGDYAAYDKRIIDWQVTRG